LSVASTLASIFSPQFSFSSATIVAPRRSANFDGYEVHLKMA